MNRSDCKRRKAGKTNGKDHKSGSYNTFDFNYAVSLICDDVCDECDVSSAAVPFLGGWEQGLEYPIVF